MMVDTSGDPRAAFPSTRRPWFRRVEPWVWIVVFAVLIAWRWPVLKGWVYRASDRPAPAPSFEWRTNLDAALAEARQVGRPVFADFHADWCPPCIAMKHDVWPDPEVGRLLTEGYVPLSVDVDRDPEAAGRYSIHGIPTILVLDPEGRVLRRASFMSRGGILDFLERGD